MSTWLFGLAYDPLIRLLKQRLAEDSIRHRVSCWHDDTVFVLYDLGPGLLILVKMFNLFTRVSGLSLNLEKLAAIPLWKTTLDEAKTYLLEHTDDARLFKICWNAKMLGVFIGWDPVARSLEEPSQKLFARTQMIRKFGLGIPASICLYNSLAISVCGFVSAVRSPSVGAFATERH